MPTSPDELEQLTGEHGTGGFALFRLPGADAFTLIRQTDGPVRELHAFDELEHTAGYVIAPFHIATDTPLLVVRPDVERTYPCLPVLPGGTVPLETATPHRRATYGRTFRACRQALNDGTFEKLVLSRCETHRYPSGRHASPVRLFLSACQAYPRQYIALWHTPQSGCWLTATPERLLTGADGKWSTMSLAGTMAWSEQTERADPQTWSSKNRHEQRVVTDYLRRRIEPMARTLSVGIPYSARAGNVVHLRTDITFTGQPSCTLPRLLSALHPTPAVCGQPKETAEPFLLATEPHERRYYAGFSGPLRSAGTCDFYVSLRCMNIEGDAIHCYAGGGLLPESEEEAEWQETERKMRTMLDLVERT